MEKGKIMKRKGYDECSEYEYYDIIDYQYCCTCKHFYDNEKQQRFERLRKSETDNECYKNKFDEENYYDRTH